MPADGQVVEIGGLVHDVGYWSAARRDHDEIGARKVSEALPGLGSMPPSPRPSRVPHATTAAPATPRRRKTGCLDRRLIVNSAARRVPRRNHARGSRTRLPNSSPTKRPTLER